MESLSNSAAVSTLPQYPLQIGFVTDTYPPEINGVAHTLERFITYLAGNGHQIELIRPSQGSLDCGGDKSVTRTLLVLGVHIPFYKSLRFGLPSDFRDVTKWDKARPDIIDVATEGRLGSLHFDGRDA